MRRLDVRMKEREREMYVRVFNAYAHNWEAMSS